MIDQQPPSAASVSASKLIPNASKATIVGLTISLLAIAAGARNALGGGGLSSACGIIYKEKDYFSDDIHGKN
jgi:hypothetical protein